MKRLVLIMIVITGILTTGSAQEKLKIGELKNGKLQVTSPDALKAFFMNSLENNGALGKDYKVSTSPEGDRFLVSYPVSGNKENITNIGVMLVRQKNEAFIVSGPPEIDESVPGAGGSATISCIGAPCTSCHPNVSWPSGNWFPLVVCVCDDAEGQCNMVLSFSVNIKIGF